MKKTRFMVALVLAAMLSFNLFGCSSNESDNQSATETQEQRQKQEEPTEPTEETQAVIDGIDSLGEITLASKEEISALRQAYGKLPAAQKKLVVNYEVLTAANRTLDELENAEKEKAMAFAVGQTVENADFRITLTGAQLNTTLESPKSRIYWTANEGATFVILEFDIEALNSRQIAVDKGAVSDVVATFNGNTYKGFDYEYLASEMWLFAKNTYFEANMPVHVYVYTQIPGTATPGSVTVDMKVAGQTKQVVI